MSVLLSELGPPSSQLSRAEDKTLHLPLFSRWELTIQDPEALMVQGNITQQDIIYMECKSLFVQILRNLPQLLSSHLNLHSVCYLFFL